MIQKLLLEAPRIRRWILLALVVGVPVLFTRVTLDPFNVPKLSLLILGVGIVACLRVAEALQGRGIEGLRAMLVPAALLTAPLLLAWAFSPYHSWALLGLQGRFQGLLPYLIVISLGILLADAFRARAGELALALCWSGAVVGGYAVVQTLGLDPFEWSLLGSPTEAISTTGNPNFTGGFVGIVLPIGLSLAMFDEGRRRVALRLLALIAAGWLVARSQGGWAAGAAAAAVVVGYAARDRIRRAPLLGWAAASLIACVTLGVVVLGMVRPESRLTTDAAVDRARWSQAAFGMGSSSPIVGRGPNSFAIEGVETRPLEDALEFNFDFPDDPHSVPMSMFANLGLPGLVGFIALLGWALWFFRNSDAPSPLQVAFLAGVIAYFVQSLVSIDELTLRVGLWASLAGLVAASVPPESSRSRSPKPGSKGSKARSGSKRPQAVKAPAALIGLALAVLGSTVWAGSLVVADVLARKASARFSAGDTAAGRTTYESALRLRDSADYRGRLAFDLKEAASLEGGEIDPEVATEALEAFSFTTEVPYLFSLVSQARLLVEWGAQDPARFDEAAEIYERAVEIDPLNPLIRAEAAAVLHALDRDQEAFDLLIEQRETVGDRYPAYWGALGLVAIEVAEEEVAKEAVRTALALDPAQKEALAAEERLEP